MSDGSAALQTALYTLLTGANPAICAGRIYDDVPQEPTYPFVEIGDSQAIGDDVTCSEGKDEFVTLHVWSREPSKKAVKDIIGQIHALVHDATLAVAGRASAHAWVRDSRTLNDPDGITRHGVVTIRVIHHA
jgi:hypothetical protein